MNAENKYTINDARIGQTIKDARNNLGMTQEKLSEAVDRTPAFIGHIERGSRSLSLPTLIGIANTLNIPIESLFADKELTSDEKVMTDFAQLIDRRPTNTKKAVLDIVRTALQHLD